MIAQGIQDIIQAEVDFKVWSVANPSASVNNKITQLLSISANNYVGYRGFTILENRVLQGKL